MMSRLETSSSKTSNSLEARVWTPLHLVALGLPRRTKYQDPQNLSIVTKVNGETRQNSSSINMVLSIQKIIASLSSVMTIEAGDIISTGTPAGVAMSMKEPRYLKDGDVVEITIERLGTIRNRVTFA